MQRQIAQFKTGDSSRSPRLDTILMVEKVIARYKGGKTITQIWKLLPKKTMWTTFTTILRYMQHLGMVRIEEDKTVVWLWGLNKQPEKNSATDIPAEEHVSKYIYYRNGNMENDIEKIKKVIIPILKSRAVGRASIFGSTARGEAGKGSDLDLLVEFSKKVTLFDLGGLKADLEEKLKRKVDIVEYDMVDERLRRRIFYEKVDIL